ncbi:hypothetical protein RhiirA1_467605 [Rhizophagus irregularis]|uniref:Uncharacterized protein n=1 Tax=Rhizophagus irregularis TaxID=588596 RepID=A0A2N0RBR3_9GLOM|nr:hypothetical protein RhiirA1_467605 [Rhizophagus irregularis]
MPKRNLKQKYRPFITLCKNDIRNYFRMKKFNEIKKKKKKIKEGNFLKVRCVWGGIPPICLFSFWHLDDNYISGQHFWTTFLDNISGQHFWTTFLDNITRQHYWTTLLNNISGQHYWTTIRMCMGWNTSHLLIRGFLTTIFLDNILDNNKNVYGVEYLPSAYSWISDNYNISGQQ